MRSSCIVIPYPLYQRLAAILFVCLRKTACSMGALLILASGSVEASSPDETLRSLWRENVDGAVWRSPIVSERKQLQEAIRLLSRSALTCKADELADVTKSLRHSSFQIQEVVLDKIRFQVIRETPDKKKGGGFYVIRCGTAMRPWVLQAPHSLYDIGTGVIVRKLLLESGARAAFWETIQRYRSHPGERIEDPVHPADVAHEHGSYFQAATIGMRLGDTQLKFIQFHGSAMTQTGYDLVISSGNKAFLPLSLGANLKTRLGKVGIFGRDTQQLGATTNVQGIALAQSGSKLFLHIEMTNDVRKLLIENKKSRLVLLDALSKPWW